MEIRFYCHNAAEAAPLSRLIVEIMEAREAGAAQALAEFESQMRATDEGVAAATPTPAPEKNKRTRSKKAEPARVEDSTDSAQAALPMATPAAPASAPSADDVVEAVRAHGAALGVPAILATLKSYGVNRAPDLKEEDRAAFILKLDELAAAKAA